MSGHPFEDIGDDFVEPEEVGEERARELFQCAPPALSALFLLTWTFNQLLSPS